MQIFIRSPGLPIKVVDVKESCLVAELKDLMFRSTGIPSAAQRLLAGGQTLKNSDFLGTLQPDCTVQLLLRLRGGGAELTLFIKVLGGKTVTLSVGSQDTLVADVQKQLSDKEGLDPSKYGILFCSQRLEAGKTLADYHIDNEATLELVLPSTSPISVPNVQKNRCYRDGCTERIAKIVGDCRYCGHGYCSRHRLPESHDCDNIQGCRQQSYEKNSSKLMGEKCVADKF
jgi:predicted nucleic acid binding AN1-type Zn finger protein